MKEECKILYCRGVTCNIYTKVIHSEISYRLHPVCGIEHDRFQNEREG